MWSCGSLLLLRHLRSALWVCLHRRVRLEPKCRHFWKDLGETQSSLHRREYSIFSLGCFPCVTSSQPGQLEGTWAYKSVVLQEGHLSTLWRNFRWDSQDPEQNGQHLSLKSLTFWGISGKVAQRPSCEWRGKSWTGDICDGCHDKDLDQQLRNQASEITLLLVT